jgi:VanZ like family
MSERFVYLLFAALLATLTVVGLVRALRASTDRCRARGDAVAIAGVLVWLAAIVFMTVRPGNGRGVRLNLIPIVVDGPGSAFDAVLNVLVFVPPALLLATLGWRLLAVIAAAFAISLTIEVAQYVTDWGRTADVNDLITNTVGATVGWLVARLLMSVGRERAASSSATTGPPERSPASAAPVGSASSGSGVRDTLDR